MRIRQITRLVLALGLLISTASVVQGADTPASEEESIGETPPRLSFTKGEVSFWRPGAQDWSQAQVNTPLAPGDQLYTGPQGDLEIQIGSRAFVRCWANTQIGLENDDPDFLQFKVTAGYASFDLRTLEAGRTVEVDTPNAAFTIEHQGYYRVDVSADHTSFITRRAGQATVIPAGGEAAVIEPSEEVVISGTESPQVTSYAAPQLDVWDKWNYARTDHLLDAVSARYVSPGVYGVDDLDLYGTWRSVPTYGTVWVPRGVPTGWAPYTTGSWMLDPYYGWTWVDTAPWGWAPYHYGRWVSANGFWAWAPGPMVVRPAYAPALVAFFGGPGAGISISAGPLVSWVALGWGEPCVPWWGPANFRQRPWWGGWSGPRVVNNVVISRTTVVNVHDINVYRNAGVRNALVVVHENQFGRGPIKASRVPQADEKNFHPIHTAPRVTATPASLAPRETRGIRPPERVMERSVVATRPPQPRAESTSGVERKSGAAAVSTPAPRIVRSPQPRETTPTLQRAPFGQSKVERRTTDRTQSPSPPKVQRQGRPEGVSTGATPSATPQAPTPQQRQPQAAGPSPSKSQPASRQPEAARAQPSSPPKAEPQKRPEEVPRGTPSVTPQAQTPQQRQPQATGPSPAKSQPASRQPGVGPAQTPSPPKVESQRRPERPSVAAPSAAPQATPKPGSQGAAPSPAASRPSGRPAEAARPPERTLPGEPANRLSPNRATVKPQQGAQSKESKRPVNQPESTPEDAQQKRPEK
jgi:hypothetical protein